MAKQTLYEILGVKRNAEPKDIQTAYEALERDFSSEPEAAERNNLVREAHRILSDAHLRQGYDESLRREILQAAATEPLPRAMPQIVTRRRLIAAGLVAVAALVWYGKEARLERLERERIEAQKAAAERAAEIQRAEYEADRQRREAQEAARKAEYADEQQRYQYERDLANSRWQADTYDPRFPNHRKEASNQDAYRIEQERRNAEYEAKREHQEAMRRLEKEKAYLKQLEYENYGWRKDPRPR